MSETPKAHVRDQEAIERARAMSISEKLLAGARLFQEECEVTRSEIRLMNPVWNEEQVEAEVNRRLEIVRDDKTAFLAKVWGLREA